ncbi:hypothetical protein EDC19_1719 [Natranaerovirga hydrolytica]|uniref:Polyketide cyclase/dehydrase/lipid transport protein n=1 Tax=Natranaerovirga hydrolytica TaxID=680378 RepID=A0A4R1MKK0_9FIRM|nr:SRPBCC domain-containing protein [Natranaerovirga hydrolytica]TCK92570.1 hypothetical protein EDC19_1719 [Natranaerovirga hydrolytica]
MKELRTEIHIQAPVEKVWKVLTDVEKYPQWNPFIKSLQGDLVEGEIIQVELQPADKKPMTMRPQIILVQKERELRWKGRMFLPGIFDGEHIFELTVLENQTTQFIHREKFSGIMVPFLKKMLDNNTRRGFEMMNQQLKERCEAQ